MAFGCFIDYSLVHGGKADGMGDPAGKPAFQRSGTIMKPSAIGHRHKIGPGSRMQPKGDPHGLRNGDLAFAGECGSGHEKVFTLGKEL